MIRRGVAGLEPLEPPQGGLADLRRRIARHDRRRATRRRAVRAAAVLLLAVAAAALFERYATPRPLPAELAGRLEAIGAGLAAPPAEPVTVPPHRRGDTSVLRVDTGDERVVYYLVGTR